MTGFDIQPELVLALLAFVVPGYVWTRVEHWVAPQFRIAERERIIRYVAYSGIALAVTFPLLTTDSGLIIANNWTFTNSCKAISALLIIPCVLGFGSGKIKRAQWIRIQLNKLNLPSLYTAETAWDKAFARVQGCLVSVLCDDGVTVFGLYNPESLASTVNDERDLYLEAMFYEQDNGSLVVDERSQGMWIPQSHVKRIEFFNVKGEADV